MRKFLSIGLLILSICSMAAEPSAKKMKVLVYTRNYVTNGKGFIHENIPASVQAIIKLGAENNFLVDSSSNPSVFTENNLKQYNAVIFSNSNNEAFATDMQRLAFRRYIEAGGGYVGIHSSTGSERTWKWFINMQGATFLHHAVYQKYTIYVFDKKHSTVKDFPVSWVKEDECYYFKKINPDINVILAADLTTVSDSLKPDTFNDLTPATWSHKYDGGRQWYTALGHNPTDYSDPTYLLHLKNGIMWVLEGSETIDYSKAYAKSIDEAVK
jgi:uncharacterized protein